jgi:hypothetical protein
MAIKFVPVARGARLAPPPGPGNANGNGVGDLSPATTPAAGTRLAPPRLQGDVTVNPAPRVYIDAAQFGTSEP